MEYKPVVFDHPLIQHKVTLVRNKNISSKEFRELISEISMLMSYEATRDLPLVEKEVETPLTKTTGKVIAGRKLALVPILRAGLGMVDGILSLIPSARVGHIGMYRDPETSRPVDYYCKLPHDIHERDVIVLDPMMATGYSAIDAVDKIKSEGVTNIKFMCVIASADGLRNFITAHPNVQVYCAALDPGLNEDNFIVPGLGDAGDRIFGTK